MDPIQIAAILMKARYDQRLSLRQLAKRVGVSHAAINTWELGKKEPSLENAMLWADALGYRIVLQKEEDGDRPTGGSD